MNSCQPVREDLLTNPILINTEGNGLDFNEAKEIADREAGKINSDPMLLAWYERKTGSYSPPVACCGEEKPAWVIYAESRGGNITVDINQEEYVFIYLGL